VHEVYIRVHDTLLVHIQLKQEDVLSPLLFIFSSRICDRENPTE